MEVLGPTAVAFLAYTSFMLLRGLIQFSDLVLQSEEPLVEFGNVIFLSVPHIVVLTIPVAFLLGLLIGIGRLSADSELVAFRASGIDLLRLYRPIGILAAVFFGATLFVMLSVVPRANERIYRMKIRLSTFGITQRIQPGVFSPEVAGRRIYVEGASADRRTLTGLIVSDRSDPSRGDVLTLARRGFLELEEAQGRLWLRLEDSVTHVVKPGSRDYERSAVGAQRILLEEANPAQAWSGDKPLRTLDLTELLERAFDQSRVVDSRLAWVELHKKFALPAGCLVFGLLGVPLGVVNRRGGRAAGFAISVAIVLGYYVLHAGGEARAIEGLLSPMAAMWFPNALLVLLGLLALSRTRRDLPLFPAIFPTLKLSGPKAPEASGSILRSRGGGGSLGSWLPVLLIDRYVLSRFLRVFALVLTSFVVLYVVIDYMEISDDIAKNKPSSAIILSYYKALIAPILLDIVPFAFLIAALVTAAGLVRTSETTALLSHGISLFRSVSSIVLLAAGAGALLYFFAERVVPPAAAESERLRHVILKHQQALQAGHMNVWFRGEGGRYFAAETFDPDARTATGVSIIELDSSFNLLRLTYASRADLLQGRGLILTEGWTRTFDTGGNSLFLKREGKVLFTAPEASRVFLSGRTDPRQMTSGELIRFIKARRQAGADTAGLLTGLYAKVANSLSALLLTLVGLPFAFRFGKRGAVAGVGLALLLGVAYFFLSQGLFLKAGETGALNPALAAWGANVLFSLAAAYGLLGVRT